MDGPLKPKLKLRLTYYNFMFLLNYRLHIEVFGLALGFVIELRLWLILGLRLELGLELGEGFSEGLREGVREGFMLRDE